MIHSVFFSLFTHFATGLLFVSLFISLEELGKLYFRVTSGVAFALIFLAMLSQPFGSIAFTELFSFNAESDFAQKVTYLSFYACLAVIAAYNVFLPRFHRPLLILMFSFGLMGVVFFALANAPTASAASVTTWMVAANGVSSALILGSVLAAMITGHWYLVQHNLSLNPLKKSTLLYVLAVIIRGLFLISVIILSGRAIQFSDVFAGLDFRSYVFIGRVVIGLLIPFVFGVMTWNAAKIRSTQSATGILYATVVLVLIGETFASFLYLMTGIPL